MLSKKYRLTKRGSFAYVYKNGQNGQAKSLKMLFVKSKALKIGFSISKKNGKACVRNLLKRRLRAAVKELMAQIKQKGKFQIVFVAKAGSESESYQKLKSDIAFLIKKLPGAVANSAPSPDKTSLG